MRPVDLSPIAPEQQTGTPVDLFLIFVGANIVATTLQVGASLPPSFSLGVALTVIGVGAIGGAALTAVLAPIGTRLRVPSIVAARAPLGKSGAQALALLLFVTNFAWIALNNVIAASISVRLTGIGSTGVWAVALGLVATVIVLGGPRAAALVDRVAVPVLLAAGVVFTLACLRVPWPAWPSGPSSAGDVVHGLDVVTGYQVSWLLMFADYSRYTRSGGAAATAVFAGLAIPALWLMPVGWSLARIAGSDDPGTMLAAAGVAWWTAVLITLASVTTNFVNIYLSSLAWRTLAPRSTGAGSVWTIGLIGTALGLISSGWLTRFAEFMVLLGSILVPVGGVFLAHFVLLRKPIDLARIYNPASLAAFNIAGMAAWIAGFVVYKLAAPIGATLPALATSMAVYALLAARQHDAVVTQNSH